MIPFDAVALVAMLRAFYADPSPASLARARLERPDYFAGGRLVGDAAGVLVLGDGRRVALLGTAPDGAAAWDARELVDPAARPAAPFALERGPFIPIDPDDILPPAYEPVFEALVTEHLIEVTIADRGIELAEETMKSGPTDADFERGYYDTAEPGWRAHGDEQRAIGELDPSAQYGRAGEFERAAEGKVEDYPASEPAPEVDTIEPQPIPERFRRGRRWIEEDYHVE